MKKSLRCSPLARSRSILPPDRLTAASAEPSRLYARLTRSSPIWLLLHLVLILGTVLILGLLLVLPLVVVLAEAFRQGWQVYRAALTGPDTIAALRLSLSVTVLSVAVNTAFGLSAAWCLSKYRFWGRNVLLILIDLPLSISPVVVGLLIILVYGQHGWLGTFLERWGLRVIFAFPGIVLATAFVTLPFVMREVKTLMETEGNEEEEAARLLGANGWQIFYHVTLPKIRWALLYGVILCTARSLGEFGAVSVVSGHIRGLTVTLPLHVELLYNEYQFSAAFAVASLLTGVGLITLIVKTFWQNRLQRKLHRGQDCPSEEASFPCVSN